MPEITYYGSFDQNIAGASGLSAYVSGQALPAHAILKDIRFTLDISAGGHASTKNWQLHWFAVGDEDGSPYANSQSKKMTSDDYTFDGSMYFTQSDVEKFTSGSFEVYAKANTTHSSKSYMGDFSITIEYEEHTRCTAPTTVSVEAASTMYETISLSWSGAKAGTNNEIAEYEIEYADSSNNSSWGEWISLGRFKTSPQKVEAPDVGVYRKYRVWTIGAAGDEWSSETAKESGSVLRLVLTTRCIAPSTVKVDKTITAAATNILHLSGAEGGENNGIAGYYIQYADSTDGETFGNYAELKTVDTTAASYDVEVPMPPDNTYRKFKVWTLGNAGSNWRSAAGTESDVTFRGHAELEGFTDSPLIAGETKVKALHMQELQERANTLRAFYGLAAYSFTNIVSGETGLKDWTAHVGEVRTAIDEISTKHDAWIDIPVNCPRADVIEQLRAVILAM